MFALFTPYTYTFLSLYFLVITFIFSINNIFIFWLFIEILMLLFIGVSYTVFTHSYTQLMLYFLFQTLASFSIIVFFMLSFPYLIFISLFIKLGMFPFFSWYISVLYRFPSFLLFLASTFHKLPPMYLFYLLYEYHYVSFLLLSCTVTVLFAAIYIVNVNDLRYLLIVSSIGNNAFLLLAVLTNSILVFLLFYAVYSINVFLLLISFNGLSAHSISYTLPSFSFVLLILILLLNLGSYPPLPGFLSNFVVLSSCMYIYSDMYPMFMFIIVFNVVMMVSYMLVLTNFIVNVFSSPSNMLVY